MSFKLQALLLWALGLAILGAPVEAQHMEYSMGVGKTYLTMDEAWALAYPGCKYERTTEYITEAQGKAIAKACGGRFKNRIVHPYLVKKDGKLVGTAYFDSHVVRSMRQTLMVAVTPDREIKRIELLAFAEPRQYTPKPKWFSQMNGLPLGADLKLGGKVRSMGGATLTANASVDCARRTLALHAELETARKLKEEEERQKNEAKEKLEKEKGEKEKGEKDQPEKGKGDKPKPKKKPLPKTPKELR